ncbi:MAG TPA: PAS domain S-box protein, partial [Opitutaceae bacterium]|nr:PAS domain S-box protein [Opitutaceae bacterium]
LDAAGRAPAIFVTAPDDPGAAVQALRRGAVDYLSRDAGRTYLTLLPHAIDRAVAEARTRAQLQRSQQVCHQVFDQAPIGKILVALDGRILRANLAAGRLLGREESELLAGGIDLVLDATDLPDFRLRLQSLTEGAGCVFRVERSCRHRAGRTLRLLFDGSLVRDEQQRPLVAVVQIQDVTGYREMEAALRKSEARLRRWLDALPVAALVCDAGGMVTYYNQQTVALWGRRPRLLDPADQVTTSMRCFELDGAAVPPERHWLNVARTERRTVHADELIIDVEGGARRTVLASASPTLDAAGAVSGVISVIVDITAMKRLEERQRLLEVQLGHARKLEAIGTLAGGIAHEFNNLLTGILGNLQLAELDLPRGSGPSAYLADAVLASRRARDLVQRMLVFSREAEGARKPVRLRGVAADAIQLLTASLVPGVTLVLESGAADPVVECNAEDIQQAVMQVGLNAMQAMRERGGLVELAVTRAVPSAELRARHPQVAPHHEVCLTVRDSGVGMSPVVLDRICEPFFTTRDPGQGAGLGLAGVYGIMRRHGGALVVESAPGQGTTVRLFFAPAEAGGLAEAGRPRVLVVDDDETMLELAREVLLVRGYAVVTFTRAADALAAFRADPGAFRVALVDYVMPGLNGLDLAKAMLAVRPDLPVILTSGSVRPRALDEMDNAPTLRFVMKPFDVASLVDLLSRTQPPRG